MRDRGAATTCLSQSASFHSFENTAPSNRGVKQLERVFHHLTALHDHFEIGLGVGNQVKVNCRVTIDKQHVGKGPCLDHAQLAVIGVARAAKRQQIGVARGQQRQSLGRGEPLQQFHRIGALGKVLLGIEKVVRPVRKFDLCAFGPE